MTDGCVRDIPGIRGVGLPCFAVGVTPNSPAREGPGTVGFPVSLAGVVVATGDIVAGDQDGVVPADRVEPVEGHVAARGGVGAHRHRSSPFMALEGGV